MSTRVYIKRYNGIEKRHTFYNLHKAQFWFMLVCTLLLIAYMLCANGMI
jgi:hypothetical protein